MKNFFRGILNKTAAVFSVAALAILVSVSSCGDTDDPDVLTVGVAFPLSGEAQGIGERMKKGVELAVEEINGSSLLGGTELRLVFKDTEGTPDGAVSAFRKLIDEDAVRAIIGPWSSSSTKETAPVANQSGVVAISPTSSASPDGITAPGDFVFRASLTVDKLVPEGISSTKSALGYSKAATIVNTEDVFSKSSNDKVLEVLENDHPDVEIATRRTFMREKNDSLPNLTEHLSAIKDSDADVVFVSALSPGRQGVITGAREMGIDVTLVISLLTATDVAKAEDKLAGSTENVFTVTNWVADSESPFVSSYSAKYGETPDAYSARAYASTQILAAAIARASVRGSEGIRAALQMMDSPETGLDTILSPEFYFDENGDGVYSPVVKEVRKGKFADIASGDG